MRADDVTARKRAEEALRVSEERFALAVLGAQDGIWDRDLTTGMHYLSPRAQEISMGRPSDGVDLRHESEWGQWFQVHPDDASRRDAATRDHLKGLTPRYEGEWRVRHQDGSYHWIHARGMCTRDASGRAVRLAGSTTDIDARKLTEHELKRSEARYALVMAASDEGYWDWIVASDDFHASPRLLEMYGFPPGTIFAGRDDFLARFPLHPEDRPKWQEAVAAHFAGKTARFDKELRILRGGETRWLHLTGLATRNAGGEVVRWTGATKDMTARKSAEQALGMSEERYALAMDASEEGHFDWDLQTDMLFTSAKLSALFGLPAEAKHAYRREFVRHIPYPPGEGEATHARMDAVLKGSALRHEFEHRVMAQSGEIRWLRARWKIQRDERGRAARVAGAVMDVTAQKLAEEDLRRMERQLRQAQRLESLGTMAGGIAHDFNNILGAMLGYGEMALRDAPKGSRQRRDLENVMIAGERGRSLVDRILAFSRSGEGERLAVHVEAVVREALELLSARLPDDVRIETDLRAGRAATLGDSTQVHQVLMNLATNAVQAMASGGVLRVSLDTARLAARRLATIGELPAGEFLILKVTDSGAGIGPEIIERIFDPFFTTKDVGMGTGLGLSLVYGIVAQLGGAIDVASTVGQGSAFTVYLPRAGDASEERRGEAPQVPRGNGERVLVVDDEELLLALATRTLEELGYAPVAFASSPAALEAFRADPGRFDAIVTDERMPRLSGSALIREVRGIRRAIPVLLVGGFVGGQATALALEAGAVEVLQKPLLARDLAMGLARVLASAT